jgi:hypothetical protein
MSPAGLAEKYLVEIYLRLRGKPSQILTFHVQQVANNFMP